MLMKKFLFFIIALVFVSQIRAQTPNDCVNAIVVCGNGTFFSNASGIGNNQEINACGGNESNSIWIRVNIFQTGTLGFNLIPNDPNINVDYDFWVYGPNTACGTLGTPIRCCTTNPVQAGLTSNVTGMIASSLVTQAGPGANGNGFVRWLNVVAGQSYYIAIDRPSGNGGFQIQWTGTAAFATPPTATSIPDVKTCSNTPNVGIFDLNTVRPLINANTTGNTISFHTTVSNAVDNVAPLPNIYANTSNPQTIYVRVTDNVTGCFTTSSFNLVVNTVPVATIAVSSNTICNGDNVTVTFTGTPNATIEYTINGGATQTAVLSALGVFTFTNALTATTTYNLAVVKALDSGGNVICLANPNDTEVVTIIPLPTATISGTTSICSGDNATITFNGTPNATITYTVNSGANQTILLDGSGAASVTSALTVNTTYNLVSVATSGTPVCSQAQSGSAVITVLSLPTATISGTATICSGTTTTITFGGTPNATVTYTINAGPNQTIVLDGTGAASLITTALTINTTYALVSVTSSGVPACSQTQIGSVLVSIASLPTVSISGTTTICSGTTTTINFNGTPNATVTYTINSGPNQTILLNGLGVASFTTSALTTNTTYALVSVASSGIPVCSQTQIGSALVTVTQLPSVNISGTTTICSGNTTTISFNGSPNATVTYTINSGANQTILLDGTGAASISTPALLANTTYALVSIASSGLPVCSQTQIGSAVITVNPIPTATISGTATICSGATTTIIFGGTPNATVAYTINSGAIQTILLDGTGAASFTTTPLTANTTYALVSVVSSGVPVCQQALIGNVLVTVTPLPTASISGTATICLGGTTTIGFSGTPNATVTYTVNSGANQTILLDGTGVASFTTPALTVNTTYALVSVTTSGLPVCSQTQSGNAVVTISLPTANISGTTTICSGSTTTISFGGTPNATVTYTINSGANQTILLSATGTASFTTPALTANTTYDLVSVTSSSIPSCSQAQVGSAIVTIAALPTATISGTTTICSGATTNITFNGTPSATVTYTVNAGPNQTILLNGSGVAALTTPSLTTTTTYALVSVASTGVPSCSQAQVGSAVVSIAPLPIASISGTTTICSGSTTTISFNGTPNATVTYTINSGANQTILLDGLGAASFTTPALSVNTTYALVSVKK